MRQREQVRLVGLIGLANTALFLAYALRRLLRLRQSTVRGRLSPLCVLPH